MVKFKDVLMKRIVILSSLGVIAIVFTVVIGFWGYSKIGIDTHISDFVHGGQTGLFTGFVVIMLRDIVKYIRAIKDEDRVKAIYIEENDERNKLINDKIGSVGYNFVILGLMVATIIAGFFNEVVFLTLLGALAFMALMKVSLKVYYNKKY